MPASSVMGMPMLHVFKDLVKVHFAKAAESSVKLWSSRLVF